MQDTQQQDIQDRKQKFLNSLHALGIPVTKEQEEALWNAHNNQVQKDVQKIEEKLQKEKAKKSGGRKTNPDVQVKNAIFAPLMGGKTHTLFAQAVLEKLDDLSTKEQTKATANFVLDCIEKRDNKDDYLFTLSDFEKMLKELKKDTVDKESSFVKEMISFCEANIEKYSKILEQKAEKSKKDSTKAKKSKTKKRKAKSEESAQDEQEHIVMDAYGILNFEEKSPDSVQSSPKRVKLTLSPNNT